MTQRTQSGREDTSSLPPVYVETLLGDAETRQSGYERYRPLSTTLGLFRYPRSLVTAVGNARKTEQVSVLTLRLEGAFQQFRATVGRDDAEASGGPGYAYFEVRGDDRLLFKSLALRSPRTMVEVALGAGLKTRSAPQDMDISVRGISTLSLVTRYASDLTQKAPQVGRARGCVWGDARLLPLPHSARSTSILRDTVRLAALRLCGPLFGSSSAGETARRKMPLLLALPPLRSPRGGPRPPFMESELRVLAQEFLQAVRRSGQPVFNVVKGREQNRLVSALPSSRGDALEPVIAAARKAGAQVVIAGALLAPQGGERQWNLDLALMDCETGATLTRSITPLPSTDGQ